MNNRRFDPFADLPTCDICKAAMICIRLGKEDPKPVSSLSIEATFACGSRWTSSQRLDFQRTKDTVPNGEFTPYDSDPEVFIEERPCPNAARFLRKERGERK